MTLYSYAYARRAHANIAIALIGYLGDVDPFDLVSGSEVVAGEVGYHIDAGFCHKLWFMWFGSWLRGWSCGHMVTWLCGGS